MMKHILTITDKNITGSNKLSASPPRIAVNAVLFDADKNIALCYMGKYDLHTLPGGGVEAGEDLQTAVKREIWEETGCQCKIIEELGQITENRYEHDFTQERSYYIAHVIGEKGALHLTNEEIAEDTVVVWLPFEQALRIIRDIEHDNYQRKFIQKRDITALTEALLWLRLHDIPGYDTFTKIEPLNKGWSPDKKYYIETEDEQKLLLRVADIDELDRKKAEYNALGKTAELDVYTPHPCGFGLCNGGANVYYLVTWLEGEDAASVMASMTDVQRYELGIKSSELLRKLHMLPAPVNAEPWDIRFQRKIDERLSQYHENKGQTENGELAIRYLNDNAHLLKNRRQTFTHGDFNTTNLIVSLNGEVGVIDFNCFNDNCDYGDPMFEMIAISYLENPDPYYYTGLWNGYAGGMPDTEFFAITAYYFAYDILSSLGGNESFDNGDFDKKALSWYDNFNRVVPSWYLDEKQIYLTAPCRMLSTAYWKKHHFPIPSNMKILHAKDVVVNDMDISKSRRYFRLIHYPEKAYSTLLPDGYFYREVMLPDEISIVADFINRCYPNSQLSTYDVSGWIKYPVFKKILWVFICDKDSLLPVALGIADFDDDVKEGSLEWIQVLPEKRGKGLGRSIVFELLHRLKDHADFVTVSGEVDNSSNPEALYRKCGFTGDDIWYVIET